MEKIHLKVPGEKPQDREYMRLALELAKKGEGWVNPNPMVGAILVKDDRIIGEGYHTSYGKLHAEREAFKDAKNRTEDTSGADLYVTLEPCCHTGKQPPCTEAVLNSGVKRVIVGCTDPNPVVAGRGIQILREKGIEVVVGVLREECEKQNEVFMHFMQKKLPFTVLKYAMTLDGKTTTVTGKSKWITGEMARARVREDRGRYMAIMTGVSTVIADDPKLTCRNPERRDPIRLIADTHLRTPLKSVVVATAHETPTWILTTVSDTHRHKNYEDAGCKVIIVPEKDGELDLQAVMKRLFEEKVDSVMIESGGTLAWTFLKEGLINRVQAYIAPKIFGGTTGGTPVRGEGVNLPEDAVAMKNISSEWIGEDLLLEYDAK